MHSTDANQPNDSTLTRFDRFAQAAVPFVMLGMWLLSMTQTFDELMLEMTIASPAPWLTNILQYTSTILGCLIILHGVAALIRFLWTEQRVSMGDMFLAQLVAAAPVVPMVFVLLSPVLSWCGQSNEHGSHSERREQTAPTPSAQ